uniref:C-type lectin domain-containing protein n=1 Tax=Sinocyclocheilus rhinocerous TaxID=307959 RepID=A0A673FT44_9TELE
MRNRLLLLLLAALMNVTFSQHHEFVYVPTPMNWMNAQKYCRQHYSDLATVHDQTNLNELLKTAGLGKFWFGLYRTTGNGVFVWSDQSSSSFTRRQPKTLCVYVIHLKYLNYESHSQIIVYNEFFLAGPFPESKH